jgi:A/G-specific adenine glycosylase
LAWFAKNARDLPWRRDSTPYRVWISEIMLQQTQVATVLPYYERFMASFPTVAELAATDEQKLLTHWEGLGYYRRARSLHSAARLIVAEYDGVFPLDFDQVLALPGIGRYTAGAILSISSGQRQPILEGNTQRVFSRWISLRGTPSETPNTRLLWQVAEAMLPRKDSGTFNQAAMELGALICTPKKPACGQCPVAGACQAYQTGVEEEIPGKVTRVLYEDRTEFAVVIVKPSSGCRKAGEITDRCYLVRPLPAGGRWAGLWDFPRTTDTSYASVNAAAKQLSAEVGVNIQPGIRLTKIRHAVTKYRISLHVHTGELLDTKQAPGKPWRYVSLAEMAELPMSVTGRRIVKLLMEHS